MTSVRTHEDSSDQASALGQGMLLNGTYRIERLLAEGGMGLVFVASHDRLPGRFVVKALHPSLADSPPAQERLYREAQVLANLNHPNIVRVLDFNRSEGGVPYVVMEYLDGRELKDILCSRALHPSEVLGVVRAVGAALMAAHACGVVHGDLKPENVLVVPVHGQNDSIKLIDFGVSNFCMSNGSPDTPTMILGTPNYMSPEQIGGAGSAVTDRSDQFSLAVMTFEMLAGEQPFADVDDGLVLARILNQPPARLAGRVSWNPSSVEAVLRRAMEKRPSARFSNVDEFCNAFEDALRSDLGEIETSARGLAARTPAAGDPDSIARAERPLPKKEHQITQKLRSGGRHTRRRVGASRDVRRNHPRLRAMACPRGGRPLLWTVSLALAAFIFFCPPERTRSLIAGGRMVSGRVAGLVVQTIDRGVNKTAALAGILKPRSSDSTSAQPFPP